MTPPAGAGRAGPGAVVVSGVGIVAGGIGIAIGICADLAALGIAVFLFFTAFFMHQFWKETEQMARIAELTQFQKESGSSAPRLSSSLSSPSEASSDLC